MEELVPSIGRVAAISSATWPNSLHTFLNEDDTVIIRTKQIATKKIGKCLSVTINRDKSDGVFGGRILEIDEFVWPFKYDGLGHSRSRLVRSAGALSWIKTDHSGTILYKQYDGVLESAGKNFSLPAVCNIGRFNRTPMEAAVMGSDAESLSAWLQLIDETSYEYFLSTGI